MLLLRGVNNKSFSLQRQICHRSFFSGRHSPNKNDAQKVTIDEEIRAANEKGTGVYTIADTEEKGWGIYAERDIPKFAKVFSAKCVELAVDRDSHSVQLSWNTHVLMNLPARFINHSCSANTGVKNNDQGAFDFYAVEDISKGEELTWDYGAAEFNSISIETCLCGSPQCRGKAIGFKESHERIRSQYGGFYADYLHDWSPVGASK